MDKANRKITFEEEADLYEKEALAEIKKQHFNGTEEMGEPYSTLQMGRRVIYRAKQELASRVEVVHARWEEVGIADYKCSRCGFRFTSADPISMFQYCRCGAKMDGDGNE